MKRYEPANHRVFAGIAALALTVATLSAAVLAPAAVGAEHREVAVSTPSETTVDYAFANAGPLTTSIDVVADRSTRLVPVVHTRVATRNHDPS